MYLKKSSYSPPKLTYQLSAHKKKRKIYCWMLVSVWVPSMAACTAAIRFDSILLIYTCLLWSGSLKITRSIKWERGKHTLPSAFAVIDHTDRYTVFCYIAQWEFSTGVEMTSSSPLPVLLQPPSVALAGPQAAPAYAMSASHASSSWNHRVRVLTWKCTQCAAVWCEGLMKSQRFLLFETLTAHSCVSVCVWISSGLLQVLDYLDLRPEVIHHLKWYSC